MATRAIYAALILLLLFARQRQGVLGLTFVHLLIDVRNKKDRMQLTINNSQLNFSL
jgi:hypothetical protein